MKGLLCVVMSFWCVIGFYKVKRFKYLYESVNVYVLFIFDI